MALSERKILRSVTVGYDLDYVSVKDVNQILKDEVVITESPHITMYGLTDYERFVKERPQLAAVYAPILGWTPTKAAEAAVARAKQAEAEEAAERRRATPP